jgi:uncharacterized membrane protein YebE (DUF533 family)
MSDKGSKLSRRQFLTVVGVGGAVSVAAVAYKALPESKSSDATSGKRRGKGYQVTEHVRNYYRTTQV